MGEFFAVVKEDYERAAKVYDLNCSSKQYGPSCFNLGKLASTYDAEPATRYFYPYSCYEYELPL